MSGIPNVDRSPDPPQVENASSCPPPAHTPIKATTGGNLPVGVLWLLKVISVPLKGNIIGKDTCTPVFMAALFTVARTWNQPECPLTEQ